MLNITEIMKELQEKTQEWLYGIHFNVYNILYIVFQCQKRMVL
jgi:hypothetical protein